MRQKFDENGLLEDKRHPNANKKMKVPGPGQYDPKDSSGTPKYSIGLKHEKKDIKGLFRLNVPGVGKYELSKDFVAPSFKVGKESNAAKTTYAKCDRCWNYYKKTVQVEEYHICSRCNEVINNE